MQIFIFLNQLKVLLFLHFSNDDKMQCNFSLLWKIQLKNNWCTSVGDAVEVLSFSFIYSLPCPGRWPEGLASNFNFLTDLLSWLTIQLTNTYHSYWWWWWWWWWWSNVPLIIYVLFFMTIQPHLRQHPSDHTFSFLLVTYIFSFFDHSWLFFLMLNGSLVNR